MRRMAAIVSGVALLAIVSGAEAQTGPTAPASQHQLPSSPGAPNPQTQTPMMGHGMMGSAMMCPMMEQSMMMRHHMMGMGPGMMAGMMGASDPKAMAQMLRLRGDMMKAMGEVLLKHAQALEQEK